MYICTTTSSAAYHGFLVLCTNAKLYSVHLNTPKVILSCAHCLAMFTIHSYRTVYVIPIENFHVTIE